LNGCLKRAPDGKQAIALSVVLLFAAPVWVFMAVLRVVVENHFFFPKIFPDYPRSQRWIPMLLPTRRSMATCLSALKVREA
jgi:hypothetical protein